MEPFDGGGQAQAGGDGLLAGDGAGLGGVGVEGAGGHAGHDGVFEPDAERTAFFLDDFNPALGDAREEFGRVNAGGGDVPAFLEPDQGVGDGHRGASGGPEGGDWL